MLTTDCAPLLLPHCKPKRELLASAAPLTLLNSTEPPVTLSRPELVWVPRPRTIHPFEMKDPPDTSITPTVLARLAPMPASFVVRVPPESW